MDRLGRIVATGAIALYGYRSEQITLSLRVHQGIDQQRRGQSAVVELTGNLYVGVMGLGVVFDDPAQSAGIQRIFELPICVPG